MYYGYFDPINVAFHALSWILFIWLIIWLVRGIHRRRMNGMQDGHSRWCDGTNCTHPSHGNAMSLLKERYAKGEISTEEFEEKKKVLSQ